AIDSGNRLPPRFRDFQPANRSGDGVPAFWTFGTGVPGRPDAADEIERGVAGIGQRDHDLAGAHFRGELCWVRARHISTMQAGFNPGAYVTRRPLPKPLGRVKGSLLPRHRYIPLN